MRETRWGFRLFDDIGQLNLSETPLSGVIHGLSSIKASPIQNKEDDVKKVILTALVASAAFATTSPAFAAQGCGVGGHRGAYGRCRPNGPPVVGPGPLVIGTFYPHHGYWDGHRYWQHRERWHGGWRYR